MRSIVIVLVALCVAIASAQFDSRSQWSSCPFNIESQNQCGSCYVFSSTEVLSDRICIMTGNVPNYNQDSNGQISPEYYLDNNGQNGGSPCNGGIPSNVFSFYATAGYQPTADGTVSDPSQSSMQGGCYPYTAGQCVEGGGGSCPNWSVPSPMSCQDGTTPFTFSGSLNPGNVALSVSAYQAEIQANGPIVAGMYICNSFQTFYSNNPTSVYTGTCSPSSSDYQGGHAVKIVGWGNYGGQNAWIIANSWSTGWGDNGYFYLPIGVDSCGIESLGAYTIYVNGQTAQSVGASEDVHVLSNTDVAAATPTVAPATPSVIPGRAVTVNPAAAFVQPAVEHYMNHVNTLSTVQHTLVSVNEVQTQVVNGVMYNMALITSAAGQSYAHQGLVRQDPALALHIVKSVVVPLPSNALAIGLGAGLGSLALIAAVAVTAFCVVRRRRSREAELSTIRVPLAAELGEA